MFEVGEHSYQLLKNSATQTRVLIAIHKESQHHQGGFPIMPVSNTRPQIARHTQPRCRVIVFMLLTEHSSSKTRYVASNPPDFPGMIGYDTCLADHVAHHVIKVTSVSQLTNLITMLQIDNLR